MNCPMSASAIMHSMRIDKLFRSGSLASTMATRAPWIRTLRGYATLKRTAQAAGLEMTYSADLLLPAMGILISKSHSLSYSNAISRMYCSPYSDMSAVSGSMRP